MMNYPVVAAREALMATPVEARPEWSGGLVFEPGLFTFTGSIGSAHTHAHACVQILDVTTGTVHVTDRHGDTRDVRSVAVIPAGAVHAIEAEVGAHGSICFVDPSGPAGRAATRRVTAAGGPDRASSWVGVGVVTTQSDESPLHPALRRALTLGAEHPDGPPDLQTLASGVGLSASRLGHLFRDELGLPFPSWRRWTRLRLALDHIRAGGNLTSAAHAAGFADSAHLNRTCRAMFGITPTEALRATGHRAGAASRIR
jgi:AraC-like DNA-binding protein/quercetin dioxygenase-like cupin family protein